MKIIENKNGTYSLQKEDGTLFDYKGRTEFKWMVKDNDGSTEIQLNDEKCQMDDGKWISVAEDGRIYILAYVKLYW